MRDERTPKDVCGEAMVSSELTQQDGRGKTTANLV